MASRRLEVVIAGNASDAVRALGQTERAVGQFDQTSQRSSGRFSQSWRSGIGQVGRAIGGLVAGAGLASFFSSAIGEAEQARSVMRQTSAVIESTGGVAGVTADHLSELAGQLSDIAAVDDEVIQQGGNVLLTFRNVKAEGGIFDDALASALDMSAALGTDLQGNVMAVGKALNDPIAGISKLTRLGVTFTDQQKEQIATMVYFGDTAGAQRIILEELADEFGGAAEANATASDKFKVASDDIKESVGTILLPALDNVASAFSGLSDWFTGLPADSQKAVTAFVAVGAAALIMWSFIGGWATLAVVGFGVVGTALYEALGPDKVDAIKDAFGRFFDSLPERWEKFQKDIKPVKEAIVEAKDRVVDFFNSWQFDALKESISGVMDQLSKMKEDIGLTGSTGQTAIFLLRGAFQFLGLMVLFVITAVTVLFAWLGKVAGVSFAGVRGAAIVLAAVIGMVIGAAQTAWEWLRKLSNVDVKVPGLGSVRDLLASAADAAQRLWDMLTSLTSRPFSVSVHVPLLGSIGFASGTESAPPGLHWVGERGPELVAFRGGERVFPHGQSMRMAGVGTATAGTTIIVHVNGTGTPQDGQAVVDALRTYERRNGPVPVRFAS